VHLGEENTIIADEVFLAVTTLQAAFCNEIRTEMLKTLNRRVLSLACVCQVVCCSVNASEDWKTGMIIRIPKRHEKNALITEASLLNSAGKMYAKYIEKKMPRNN